MNHKGCLLVGLALIAIMSGSLLFAAESAPTAALPPRERLSLDEGWRFHLGDVPMPVVSGHDASYMNAKAGQVRGAAAPDYDDNGWRRLNLPHDWVVEGPFDPKANLSQGYRSRGIAWYRRHFRIEPEEQGRHVELRFDGIATHATVWVNGLLVHRNYCGYTPFSVDLTPILTYGERLNTIAVRVDADVMEGWWYEGGGIYRHSWLIKRNSVHVETDGVYANPVRAADGTWSVPVEVTLANMRASAASTRVVAQLFDPEGNAVGGGTNCVSVPALGSEVCRIPLAVAGQPRLWSVDSPVLYSVKVGVYEGEIPSDTVTVTCGFRTLRFDADKGFFLNDKPLKLQGTCNHQDHAGVGVAVPAALWEYRVRRLKEMGSNAYRSAHNPPAPEFLDACDRQGMLVIDESRNFNYTPEYLGQLRAMLKRDRNHPSVFLWSVFNEEPMQGTPQGREMVRRMVAEVKRWDPTRPVTAAMNGGMLESEGVFEAVDVMGFNYVHVYYDDFHRRHPALPIFSSEDTAAFATRDEFENDAERNVIASLDTEHAAFGGTQRESWRRIAERPFMAGGFAWTGFDYRGEPLRLAWPSVSSVFGIMDVCGFPKAAYYVRQSMWIHDRPVLALAPHWTWPGREGKPVKVVAMTNADRVSLVLNGRDLGEKPRPAFDYVEWDVPYAPGKLEAIAYREGREVARTVVETAGECVALALEPDRPSLRGDGWDAMPVTVKGVDAKGHVVPGNDALVTFTVEGPGENIGHGNGDHNCHDPDKGPERRLFHGLAQLIVQSHKGGVGRLKIRASAPGLKAAEVEVEVCASAAIPAVPVADPGYSISNWRLSPVSHERPDPLQAVSRDDMNSWPVVKPGRKLTIEPDCWAIWRAEFTPWQTIQQQGGHVVLSRVVGVAEVYLDGVKVADKPDPAAGTIEFTMRPASKPRVLAVLLQARPNAIGIEGVARVVSGE